jgi:hypothetical protein
LGPNTCSLKNLHELHKHADRHFDLEGHELGISNLPRDVVVAEHLVLTRQITVRETVGAAAMRLVATAVPALQVLNDEQAQQCLLRRVAAVCQRQAILFDRIASTSPRKDVIDLKGS